MPRRALRTQRERVRESEPESNLDPRDASGRLTDLVQGAPLEPIRTVVRELTRPDGSTLEVEVPVFPPFRLADASSPRVRRARSAPSLKRGRRR